MKYISIDCEMSGTNPEIHKIIEFGAVIEDSIYPMPLNTLPKFHAIVSQPNHQYIGEPFAIQLNNRIFKILAGDNPSSYSIIPDYQLAESFHKFLLRNGFVNLKLGNPVVINVAGKNFGSFDNLFLKKIPKWNDFIRINTRIIDPGILYADWLTDETLPNMATCKTRAGLSDYVSHYAIDDALDVIQLIRFKQNKTQVQ